jgi:hypothetical protein
VSDTKEHIIAVQEVLDTNTGSQVWLPRNRFASIKDGQKWLATQADIGKYHLLAFRYEDVQVGEPKPQPARNEVDFGKQHLIRRVVTEEGEIQHE